MQRRFGMLVCAVLLVGCGRDPASTNLVVLLPETSDPPAHAPERITTLKIDGKDHFKAKQTRLALEIAPAAGKEAVTIEYSYWPNTYTNVIRTRVVELAKNKKVEVDLAKEDGATPDKIKPIFFPTPDDVVAAMCKLGGVTNDDVVYDIGCGDGRIVIAAVKDFGARKGVGIDIDPDLVKKCEENAAKRGVADRTEFRAADALALKELPGATVVLVYLSDELMRKLQPILKEALPAGARVVSHRFTGDWTPERTTKINATNNYGKAEDYELHLWTMK